MADPVKLQIRDDLVTDLKAILRGGGYYTDAGLHVSTRREPLAQVNSPWFLALYSGAEQRLDELSGQGRHRSRAEFVVTGYARSKDPDAELVKLEADVKKAILTDLQRSGLAVLTEFVESTTDYGELADQDAGVVEMSFAVTYNWTVTAP